MARDPIGEELHDERFRIEMQGLSLIVPPGWEARISLASAAEPGSQTFPVTHVATVPLPRQRGDYGSNVVERLGPNDVFVSLIEMGPGAAHTPLYPQVDQLPRTLLPDEFHPRQLQRAIPGQGGVQKFFTYRDRAFCLYVVLGSFALRGALSGTIEELLNGLSVEPIE